MEPLLIVLVPGVLGGIILAVLLGSRWIDLRTRGVDRRLEPTSPSLINMAHIPVQGGGGLGIVAAVIAVALADSRIRGRDRDRRAPWGGAGGGADRPAARARAAVVRWRRFSLAVSPWSRPGKPGRAAGSIRMAAGPAVRGSDGGELVKRRTGEQENRRTREHRPQRQSALISRIHFTGSPARRFDPPACPQLRPE